MDKLYIRGISLRCIIGVNPDERQKKQDVLIHVCLHTSTRKPGRSDNFKEAVDYGTVAQQIVTLVKNSRYHLIEALAEAIAEVCLQDRQISRVNVRVEKPGALRQAGTVGVEISRRRKGR